MTYYQFTGLIFNILPYLFLLSILLNRYNLLEYLLILFFSVGSIFLYEYEILGLISLQQILLFGIGLMFFIIYTYRRLDEKDKKLKQFYTIIFVYFSIITIFYHVLRFDFTLYGNFVQNELRSIVQIMQLGSMLLGSLVLLSISKKTTLKVINIFVISILFLAFFGLLQEFIYLLTNFDIFPMRKDFFNPVYGITDKMYGFVRITVGIGEPKQVAKYLNLGLSCLLFIPSLIKINKFRLASMIVIILSILFTFSTTGYIILFVQLMIYFINRFKQNIKLLILVSLSFLSIFIIIFVNTDFFMDKIIYLVSLGDIPFLENTDSATVKFLINNPWYSLLGVGIGNIVSYAYMYAPSGSLYINNAPYTLRRGIIKNLAEGGLIGSCLINYVFLYFIKNIRDNNIRLLIIFLVVFYNFLTVEALNEFLFLFMTLLYNLDKRLFDGRGNNENTYNNSQW